MGLYQAVKLASKQPEELSDDQLAHRAAVLDVRRARERRLRHGGQGRGHGARRRPALPALRARRQQGRPAVGPARRRQRVRGPDPGRPAGNWSCSRRSPRASPSRPRSATRARSSSSSRTTSRCAAARSPTRSRAPTPPAARPTSHSGSAPRARTSSRTTTARSPSAATSSAASARRSTSTSRSRSTTS